MVPKKRKKSLERGGHQQRRAERLASGTIPDQEPSRASALAQLILGKYAWGEISAPFAQELAHAGLLDGIDLPDLRKIAECGGMVLLHRTSRGIWNLSFLKCDELPQPFFVKAPALNPKQSSENVIEAEVPLLLLQDWLHLYSTNWSDLYDGMFGIERLAHFWGSVDRRMPVLQKNQLFDVPEYDQTFVPLVIHGDGVEFKNGGSMNVYDIKPLLSDGPTKKTTLLWTVWPKETTARLRWGHSADTWGALHEVMRWDLECVWRNEFARTQPDGSAWPPGSIHNARAGKQISPRGHRFL